VSLLERRWVPVFAGTTRSSAVTVPSLWKSSIARRVGRVRSRRAASDSRNDRANSDSG
jgi:hypothetical protein